MNSVKLLINMDCLPRLIQTCSTKLDCLQLVAQSLTVIGLNEAVNCLLAGSYSEFIWQGPPQSKQYSHSRYQPHSPTTVILERKWYQGGMNQADRIGYARDCT